MPDLSPALESAGSAAPASDGPASARPAPDGPASLTGDRAVIDAARALLEEARLTGRRHLLGIAGSPGAGKSTLTALLAGALPAGSCVVVPMDGFHLADVALDRLGRRDRKGAPDTFDAAGYTALLARLREARPGDEPVWAPMFERDLEQPLAGAIEVSADIPLVITEGNYLLLEDGPFAAARAQLDACWYVEVPEDLRHERLIARHEQFGKDEAAARDWALGPDERNALLVTTTRARADAVVHPA